MSEIDLTIQPACAQWTSKVRHKPAGEVLGYSLQEWRSKTRAELGLEADRPIVATGHQTLLWHPGILAKYLVADAMAARHSLATANLIVDQHAEGFGEIEVPLRRTDDTLTVRSLHLARPRRAVPMGRHAAFTPPRPPQHLPFALPSVQQGVDRIYDAVYAHRDEPNAAAQMARALDELMQPWVRPMPAVTSTDLIETSLARALLREMVEDPWRCAEAYNAAVQSLPEAGVAELLVRDDYVELPIWRIRPGGQRMHGYDNDAQTYLEDEAHANTLMPRALFMTALMRLGMCDLFIHGTGGANYDRAMEQWIRNWIGVDVSPIAVTTANLYLPLLSSDQLENDGADAVQTLRQAWHDPVGAAESRVQSGAKRALLARVQAAPYGSDERQRAFYDMHRALESMRAGHSDLISAARARAERAVNLRESKSIAARRDWAFPLYPTAMIDQLAAAAREAVSCKEPAAS